MPLSFALGRSTNPVGGFAEEDLRGPQIPGDAQKVEGPTFCKANRNCAKAPTTLQKTIFGAKLSDILIRHHLQVFPVIFSNKRFNS
jgi:hypothetical protein